MYDSVLYYRDRILRDPSGFQTPGLPDNYLLATIHRAENTDQPGNLQKIFTAFRGLKSQIVLPVHPRTKKLLGNTVNVPGNVILIDPVGYLQMLKLTMDAEKVMTDSGGLQKEAYFLGKPCITLRTETEWVETLHDGWNIITGCDPEMITKAVEKPVPSTPGQPFFGDGNAACLILEKLLAF